MGPSRCELHVSHLAKHCHKYQLLDPESLASNRSFFGALLQIIQSLCPLLRRPDRAQ